MTNRSDEPVPGGIAFAAPMMHSMDFHAAMVSPQDKYRSDKIAAAYDHAVIENASRRQHEAAFLSLELTRPAGKDAESAVRRSVERIAGVDRGTVRIALEAGALSLAFDQRRVAPGSLLGSLDRELAPLGVRVALLRFGNPETARL
jgi:hypothetical protein